MKPLLLPVSPPFSQMRLQCPNYDVITITSLMQEMPPPSIRPILDNTTGGKERPPPPKNKLI
jgi:hypothetical protein